MFKRVSFFLILLLTILLITSCGGSSDEEISSEQSENTTVEEDSAEDTNEQYVNNEAINDFIISFNAQSEEKLQDIDNSSRNYKATASCDGYWLTIEDLSDEFRVNIDETNDTAEAGVSGMKSMFFTVTKALDSSISDDDINNWFDENTTGYMSESNLGSLEIHFYPDTENSRGHIQIVRK